MKPKIFITAKIPNNAIEILSKHFDLLYNEADKILSKEEIITGVKNSDILLCLLRDVIDKDVILANPNLKGICNYAVGYNNIDVDFATEKGIPVTNTPDVLTETTADLAWSILMAVSRRIKEADDFIRNEKFTGWQATLLLGSDIYGKTLGIIGAGRIGSATAKRSLGFDMNVLYTSNNNNTFIDEKLGGEKMPLDELLQKSDFVSIHLPLTEKTGHLITKNELKKMKKTAFLINTARGKIVKEDDLVWTLENGVIAGAALDVFEFEPKVTQKLLKMKNVVLTPHIGSASKETREKMAEMTANGAISIINEEFPKNLVNTKIIG